MASPVVLPHIARQFVPGTILVVKEKHGTRYFDAGSVEKAGKACRKLLAARHGVYWNSSAEAQECINTKLLDKPEVPQDDAKKLPATLKKVVLDEWATYDRKMIEFAKEREFAERVEKCLKDETDDAIELILLRDRFEYEEVDVVHLENP